MATSVGSIELIVTLDGSELGPELTSTVNAAMANVARSVQRGMRQVNQEFGSVDNSGFQQLTQELGRIAAEMARINGRNLDQAADSAGDATRRIDALERALAEAAAESEQLRRDLDRVGDAGQEAGQEASGGIDRMEAALGTATKAAAGLAAGLAAAGGAGDLIGAAIERADVPGLLKAQLDLTADEAAQAGRITAEVYSNNFGESIADVRDAVGAVISSLADLGDAGPAQVQRLTESALTLASAFGIEVAEATQSVNNLIRRGLATDAQEGFDLIGAAMQRIPAQMRDELLPILDEYAVSLEAAGLNGQQALGFIVNAAQDGAIAMDKAGDSVKEFIIRATDINDTGAVEAIQALGLNAEEMSNALLTGGEDAFAAFNAIITGLSDIENPAEQAAASIAIFGTPLEDLSKNQIPEFLAQITNGESAMGDFQGSVDEMAQALTEGPSASLEAFRRSLQQNLIDALGNTVQFFQENEQLAYGLAAAIGVLATAYIGLRSAAAVGAVIQGVTAAMTGATLAANAAALSTGAYTVALGAQRAAALASAAATNVAAVAVKAFSASLAFLAANPIVLAIAAIVAALTLFFTKTELGKQVFEQIKEFALEAWEAIKEAISAAWEFIQPILQSLWSFITETLAPALMSFWQNVIVPVWNGIVAAVQAAWDFIQPIFQGIWDFIQNVLIPVFRFLWENVIQVYFQLIGAYIGFVWNNIVKPVFDAVVGFISGTLWPAFQRLAADIQEAWERWSGVVSAVWENVIQPVFRALVSFIADTIVPTVLFLWNNVVQPAFDGIGAVISFVWENIISPTFDALKAGVEVLGDIIGWLWNTIVQPAFDGIGAVISFVWENVISPAFNAFKAGIEVLGDTFGTVVSGIETVWNTLRGILAKPINFLINTVYNNGIRKAWNAIEPFIPGLDAMPELSGIPEYAVGGRVGGRAGRDKNLALLTLDEHVLTVSDVMKAGGQNIVYAIRDMIQRGIPFTWDNGRIITELGRDNLSRYGAAVRQQGFGNVDPQGLFDPLATVPIPQFYRGGAVTDQPWMQQLIRAHEFARAQHGKPYQWAGPTGPGSSFDCSGFMGSIAAVILGLDPWRRYWATASFAGYPNVGPQGFTKGTDAGFVIGVTDDPGGPGGGHTAGVLGKVDNYIAARVESGGAQGDVHYGSGTDVMSFASQYYLPIGANGFFEGGTGTGPSPEDQRGFLRRRVEELFNTFLDPIKASIAGVIGSPPPEFLDIPPKFLDFGRDKLISTAFGVVDGLTDNLGEAWSRARDVGSDILDAINPFDHGGIARGEGVLLKDTIEPERVLSPEQTRLFEALIAALTKIATSGISAAGQAAQTVVVDLSNNSVEALKSALGVRTEEELAELLGPEFVELEKRLDETVAQTGELISDTTATLQRTATSQAEAAAVEFERQAGQLLDIANKLSGGVLGPIMSAAVDEGLGILEKWLAAASDDIVDGTDRTTDAVKDLDSTVAQQDTSGEPAFGAPGSSFDAVQAVSDAIVSVANTARQAFEQVAQDIANAALAQTPSEVGNQSRGQLGRDISGGFLIDLIVRLTGVEIEILDLLENTYEEIQAFRSESFSAFNEEGALISDTAAIIQRNQSSIELAAKEQERIQKALIKAVLKYLILNVLLPIITAILGAMITLVSVAIGAAIGAAIPIIGPAIGAAVGAVIGAALAGLASVFTSLLAVGAGAALDAFDDGGIARGTGFMPKNTIAPERVLSPEQTKNFGKLVEVLDRNMGSTRTIQIGSMNITGRDPAQKTADNLLALLN